MKTFCDNCKHLNKTTIDSFRIESCTDLLNDTHHYLHIYYKALCPFCGNLIYGIKRKELKLEDVLKLIQGDK